MIAPIEKGKQEKVYYEPVIPARYIEVIVRMVQDRKLRWVTEVLASRVVGLQELADICGMGVDEVQNRLVVLRKAGVLEELEVEEKASFRKPGYWSGSRFERVKYSLEEGVKDVCVRVINMCGRA